MRAAQEPVHGPEQPTAIPLLLLFHTPPQPRLVAARVRLPSQPSGKWHWTTPSTARIALAAGAPFMSEPRPSRVI
jgi:hypothetical protein